MVSKVSSLEASAWQQWSIGRIHLGIDFGSGRSNTIWQLLSNASSHVILSVFSNFARIEQRLHYFVNWTDGYIGRVCCIMSLYGSIDRL